MPNREETPCEAENQVVAKVNPHRAPQRLMRQAYAPRQDHSEKDEGAHSDHEMRGGKT